MWKFIPEWVCIQIDLYIEGKAAIKRLVPRITALALARASTAVLYLGKFNIQF